MDRELVMYIRSFHCPSVSIATSVLLNAAVPYREIIVDTDPVAKAWLLENVGFMSVPTLVIADSGQDTPHTEPEPLPAGQSPRGVDRGPVITEPRSEQLKDWLRKQGFIDN
ncbi:glutaredoxin domain-containing protein [Chloroflexota bacterium]